MKSSVKNALVLSLVLVISFFFIGCSEYTDGYDGDSSASDNKEYSGEERYEKQLTNNISVSAKVDIPEVDKKPVIQVERQSFDNNKVKKIFLNDEEVQSKTRVENFMGEELEYTISETKNGKALTVGKGLLEYNTAKKTYLNTIFSSTDSRIWNKDSVDFISKNDAVKKAVDLCKSLDINVNDTPLNVIALDLENMKKAEEEFKKDGSYKGMKGMDQIEVKTPSKEDEAYYIELSPVYNGINLIPRGISLQTVDKFLDGGKISILIDKNGVYQFVIEGALYKQVSVKEENPKTLNIDQALDKVKDIYKDIITSDKIKIVEIRLNYSLDKEEPNLRPTWYFLAEIEGGSKKEGKEEDVTQEIYIDAITGEQII